MAKREKAESRIEKRALFCLLSFPVCLPNHIIQYDLKLVIYSRNKTDFGEQIIIYFRIRAVTMHINDGKAKHCVVERTTDPSKRIDVARMYTVVVD